MWSSWEREAGNGPDKRYRSVTTKPSEDGEQCPPLEEYREIGLIIYNEYFFVCNRYLVTNDSFISSASLLLGWNIFI